MTKIYRTTDRVKVNVEGITFSISPLSYIQKSEIQAKLYKAVTDQDMMAAQDAAVLSIKYAVKSVKGLFDGNDEPYQLELEDNQLTQQCIDDLLNIKQNTKLASVCTSLVHGLSTEIIDPTTGEKIEGVSFEVSEKKD
jgi:hypothetical protein